MSTYWLIRGEEEIDERLHYLKLHLIDKGLWPIKLEVKKFVKARSVSQNNLLWMWCEEIAAHLTANGRDTDKEQVKTLMCHKFLGYRDIQLGDLTIERQLRGTSDLDTGEMHHFMTQIEQWAFDLDITLTIPVISEYYELREAQNA